MKKLDKTKDTRQVPDTHAPTLPQNTCSPETRFITFRAAVYVEPPVIALETCITLQLDKHFLIQHNKTKLAPKEHGREFIYICVCVRMSI